MVLVPHIFHYHQEISTTDHQHLNPHNLECTFCLFRWEIKPNQTLADESPIPTLVTKANSRVLGVLSPIGISLIMCTCQIFSVTTTQKTTQKQTATNVRQKSKHHMAEIKNQRRHNNADRMMVFQKRNHNTLTLNKALQYFNHPCFRTA